MVRSVVAEASLRPYIETELAPGSGKWDAASLDAHIRATAATAHHPLGTCRMGPDRDPRAVLDDELRVRGTRGLRVVDGSAMPDLVGGNINAPIIMLAEKAADIIRAIVPSHRESRSAAPA